jgi:hypothetical protein
MQHHHPKSWVSRATTPGSCPQPQGVQVEDLGSKNGTHINGQKWIPSCCRRRYDSVLLPAIRLFKLRIQPAIGNTTGDTPETANYPGY